MDRERAELPAGSHSFEIETTANGHSSIAASDRSTQIDPEETFTSVNRDDNDLNSDALTQAERHEQARIQAALDDLRKELGGADVTTLHHPAVGS